MKWGTSWGLKWGWIEDLITQTVQVRIINGTFRPCNQCHWFSVCVIPKGKHFQTYPKFNARVIYECHDFTSKTPYKVN